MRDPNAKTLVNKALAEEMRASARLKRPASAAPESEPSPEGDPAPPSRPQA